MTTAAARTDEIGMELALRLRPHVLAIQQIREEAMTTVADAMNAGEIGEPHLASLASLMGEVVAATRVLVFAANMQNEIPDLP